MISICKITFIFLLAYSHGQCFGLLIDSDQSDELIGVAVLYRHGDRGPIGSYPNDPYHDVKYWPNGFGQLVDAGKLRQFNLGKWLRSRYNGFLPEVYNAKDILVRSTDVDRTLMSAASNLAGLYYPTDGSTIWQKNLTWNPIPIHTVPKKDDNVLDAANYCTKFEEQYNSTIHSPYFQNVLQIHEAMKVFIEKKSGWNIEDITKFETLYSVFYVYKMHNASYLPEWADQIDMSELNYLAGLSFSIETFTNEMQRFKVGPFYNYLHNYFDGIINGTNPKFLMLSAHDGNVASILNSYGVYDYHAPEFAETIIWELYKNANDDVYLKIYNKQSELLKELAIKQCQHKCSYDKYLEIMHPISVDSDQWKKDCEKII